MGQRVQESRVVTSHLLSRRATARDVAERVGCSPSTVSLVFNGKDAGRVSPQIRGQVYAAAAELGYRVNTTASALARGQLESIGFVSPDPTNPFFSWCSRDWRTAWTMPSR
jgi:DNA-binding LacI/PurR family transcriptional regulator